MSAETDDSAETCEECGLTLTDGECLTDGCAGPVTQTDDTSASSLMGGGSEEPESTEPQGEVFDPAEESDPHRDGMMQAAADAVPSSLVADDEDDLVWHELDEEERRARMRQTEIDGDEAVEEHSSNPDAVSEPAQLDWHAFARRYGFHYAGQGAQSRFVSRHKLEEATRLDDEIAGGGESFVDAALAHESVPLMVHDTGRIVFRSEVLEQ